ncbi:hypothetical protein HOLleu_43539 [Holothuria leucospilota]|uniref:Uncharacterized protein n=1 Tax=Holothuria leucospilota TaxID=206669 RepID=A0A9Q0YEB0_HOLLE|nr:hypothetical protein HOLleu_43539 [Holothuria leucospilota]
MEFFLGQKVQARDELGRWENGHVKDIKNVGLDSTNGLLIRVGFDGWSSEFDVEVAPINVRKPIDPFEGQLGEIGRKRVRGANRHVLSILRSLTSGDQVTFRGEDGGVLSGEVKEVDRFRRSVVVCVDEEDVCVPAALLVGSLPCRGTVTFDISLQ